MSPTKRLLTSVLLVGNQRNPFGGPSRPAYDGRARHTRAVSIVTVPFRRPVRPRDPHEPGRVATPLELLFDLVFVVAVASNAAELHHGLAEGHLDAVLGYVLTFFAIWWAWMNYTWFASAYGTDDVVFRLLTFTIMAGALCLAAGVPGLFADGNDPLVVFGYAVMRFGMVLLWLRVARGHPERRATALWYAGGIALVQVLWIGRLAVPEGWAVPTFLVLVLAELAVPLLAEARHSYTPFHPHHIAERYGLMTIIVLGEVILSAAMAIQGAIVTADAPTEGGTAGHSVRVAAAGGGGGATWEVVCLVVGGLLVFSLWWLYFSREQVGLVESGQLTWVFGYAHYLVFAGIAAVGACLAAAVDVVSGGADAGPRTVTVALAVAITVAVGTIAVLHALCPGSSARAAVPGGAMALGCLVVDALVPVAGLAVLLMGLVLVGVLVVAGRRGATEVTAGVAA